MGRVRPAVSADHPRVVPEVGSQPSDADDVAQEVLLKLLTAMKKFRYDPSRSFRAWLKTVTQNAWKDFVASPRLKSAGNPSKERRLFQYAAAAQRDSLHHAGRQAGRSCRGDLVSDS
jgi:RNA polymerase sigma factor (sigma-70 family)